MITSVDLEVRAGAEVPVVHGGQGHLLGEGGGGGGRLVLPVPTLLRLHFSCSISSAAFSSVVNMYIDSSQKCTFIRLKPVYIHILKRLKYSLT